MIKLEYEGVKYNLPNTPQELTIKQFDRILYLLGDEKLSTIEKWCRIFEYLKVPIDVVEDIEPNVFVEIIKNFNTLTPTDIVVTPEIEVNDVVYKLELDSDGKPKFKVRDIKFIELAIKNNPINYLSTIMAIAYKRDDVAKNIQYDNAHLEYKKELFEQQTADKVIPLLISLGGIFIKDYELIKNNVEE